jgi:hypothetical protein
MVEKDAVELGSSTVIAKEMTVILKGWILTFG